MSGFAAYNIAKSDYKVDVKSINQQFSPSSAKQRLKPRLSRSLTPPRLVQEHHLRTSTPPSRVRSSISGEVRHVSRGASRICCQKRRQVVETLEKDNMDLIHLLRQEQDYQRNLEAVWRTKLEDVKTAHKDNLVQLGTIVSSQKQVQVEIKT